MLQMGIEATYYKCQHINIGTKHLFFKRLLISVDICSACNERKRPPFIVKYLYQFSCVTYSQSWMLKFGLSSYQRWVPLHSATTWLHKPGNNGWLFSLSGSSCLRPPLLLPTSSNSWGRAVLLQSPTPIPGAWKKTLRYFEQCNLQKVKKILLHSRKWATFCKLLITKIPWERLCLQNTAYPKGQHLLFAASRLVLT